MAKSDPVHRLRLRPANPFDLIRLLARSQHDPRKAVAELVQNSLDAGAARVDLTWFTEKGSRALRLHDDGRGVFPDMGREEALRRIATTIGHSYKRSLTAAERQQLMAVGKYGIGLLGFWSVGKIMEIRSRVGGGETWSLRLKEDSPGAHLARVRSHRLQEEGTYTEVTILGIHEAAARQVRPSRLQVYLASELRGQLLERETDLRIHDRVARGRALKEYVVRPRRFAGRPIERFRDLPVEGQEAARVEIYLLGEDDEPGRVALSCGGTTVLDDLAEVDGTGEPRGPWDSGRFEGMVEFPGLEVAPGTRRGFRRDAAADAFLAALEGLERDLRELLADEGKRREEEKDRDLARQIRQAFRPLARMLPEYDLFAIRGRGAEEGGGREPEGGGGDGSAAGLTPEGAEPGEGAALEGGLEGGIGEDSGQDPADGDPPLLDSPPDALFPPGPLDAVRLVPARARIPVDASRPFRARALDADGRPAAGACSFAWTLEGPGALEPNGDGALFTAPASTGTARVLVVAVQGEVRREGAAEVRVVESPGNGDRDVGIPEPIPVHEPAGGWRSRLREGAWEYNTGHRDYAEVRSDGTRRLRYLVQLFAKEVVLRNFGQPGDGVRLERMVEVLTYLREGRPRGRKAGSGAAMTGDAATP